MAGHGIREDIGKPVELGSIGINVEMDQNKGKIEFRNVSGLVFKDIDDEEFRQYMFVRDGKVIVLKIVRPIKLHVSKSGGHRLFTEAGTSMYIPYGWIGIEWKAKKGADHFRF